MPIEKHKILGKPELRARSLVFLLTLLPLSFFWVPSLASTAANKTASEPQAPLWKLDVRALGYVPYTVHDAGINRRGPLGQFSFSQDDQIIVTFASHTLPGTLSRRDEPDLSGFRLHALFVNARTGQLLTTKEWPTSSLRSGIIPATKGNFLIVRPDRLILYSPDFQLLKELELPVAREAFKDDWDLVKSPGGKLLLVDFEVASSETHRMDSCFEVRDELIDAESLQVTRSWSQFGVVLGKLPSGPCASDPSIYFWGGVSDDGSLLTTDATGAPAIGRADGRFQALCSHSNPNCRSGSLANNQTVFVWPKIRQKNPITLISTSGEVLPIQDLDDREMLHSIARSVGGRRFAISVERSKGGSRVLDLPEHWSEEKIMVYDIPSHRWIYTLDAKKQGITKIPELALSPDGKLLALIDQDGILRAYRIADTPGTD